MRKPKKNSKSNYSAIWALVAGLVISFLVVGCNSVQVSPKVVQPRVLADSILVEKSKKRLTLFSKGKVIKVYVVALGRGGNGPKFKTGDLKTPEGEYIIDGVLSTCPYYRALHISYPNAKDIERGRQFCVNPGSAILIHGILKGFEWLGPLHSIANWTQGCIAVTNSEIEELIRLVPMGTKITIRQ